MAPALMTMTGRAPRKIPWFGARKVARELAIEVEDLRTERDDLRRKIDKLGLLSQFELDERRAGLEREIAELRTRIEQERREASAAVDSLKAQLADVHKTIIVTEDVAILQEAGVYHYHHPLSDAVAYQKELEDIESEIKEMTRKDGGAVLATTNWTVNGSATEGRKMVRDFSKLMLRAFNAEADNLVRGLKPYRLDAAIENRRREFFRATPIDVKAHLAELAGELLQFQDVPDALEVPAMHRGESGSTDRSRVNGDCSGRSNRVAFEWFHIRDVQTALAGRGRFAECDCRRRDMGQGKNVPEA